MQVKKTDKYVLIITDTQDPEQILHMALDLRDLNQGKTIVVTDQKDLTFILNGDSIIDWSRIDEVLV